MEWNNGIINKITQFMHYFIFHLPNAKMPLSKSNVPVAVFCCNAYAVKCRTASRGGIDGCEPNFPWHVITHHQQALGHGKMACFQRHAYLFPFYQAPGMKWKDMKKNGEG